MTAISDIKALLKALKFSLEEGSEDIWIKSYANHNNYKIKVDIAKAAIDYGKQITIGGKTSSNFKAAENFVVLECVNRLLEKGYKPKSIHLEKTWATGHGTSGRLDIFVTRENASAYLMIECKNFGAEFEKEFKKILKDGGQLFTYFQQDKNADILMLYASHLDNGKIECRNEIIKIEEDYRQTGNVKDFYDRWNKLPKNNGVLDSWVKAYDFQSKALTPNNLKDIKQEDSSFIFNQFLEILRHNVVSDKPNAFNKIFTLFLCKIYDEKVTKPNDELAFQWFYAPYTYEGISYPPDDNISFQKRLTDLYKKGMKEFLDKSVTDISDADFEKKYGKLDSATKKQILDEFTEIRLKKNNEFAIKEVFNDDSFVENAKVVKEVVELLQGFKIRYTKKQQYLSDFFELLLTTGLKQESGQFFTPVPIAQFIIKSIPLDKIVAEKLERGEKDNLLPTIIDYAAGSGHFITESMHEVQRIIDKADPKEYIDSTAKKISTWKTDHFDWAFQYVYGIEKDYRLVKVGKVGCYLHGDGLAQIVHSDGLGNFSKTEDYKGLLKKRDKDFPKENKQFDIVVSNPPYSVSAFKNNARKYYTEEDFDIYDKLTDQSSEIECLFIERTKQLLKDGGIAGIILPSSILNNGGIYTKAREIILKHFEIIAIAEFGSNTFMATGTNTVTLFLRRRNNYDTVNIQDLVVKAANDKKDITINGIEKPVNKYVAHAWEGLTVKDYFTLLSAKPNEVVEKSELYKEYRKKIKSKSEDEFWKAIIALEIEKLFYFILTYPQKIVLVKNADKNGEKEFLGYEFSNRRGSEGIHPINRGKSIDECTKLFDPEVFENPQKASTYIYQAFQSNLNTPIHPDLENSIVRLNLVEMLAFDRVDFEKSISLAVKKKIKIESKYELVKLEKLVDFVPGLVYAKNEESASPTPKHLLTASNIDLVTRSLNLSEFRYLIEGKKVDEKFLLKKDDIFICTSSGSRAHLGKSVLITDQIDHYYFGGFCAALRKIGDLEIELVYEFLQTKEFRSYIEGDGGQNINNLRKDYLLDFKIPLPPKDIRQKVFKEIQAINQKEKQYRTEIQNLYNKLNNITDSYFSKPQLLVKIQTFAPTPQYGISKDMNMQKEGFKIFRMNEILKGKMVDNGNMKCVDITPEEFLKFKLHKGDILFNRTNSIELVGKSGLFNLDDDYCFASYLIRLKVDSTKAHPSFVSLMMNSEIFLNIARASAIKAVKQANINAEKLRNLEIPLPLLTEQKKVVLEIEKIEEQISKLDKDLANISVQKEKLFEKYL